MGECSITLHLYASFRQYAGGQASISVPIQSGQTVESVVRELKIPLDEVRLVFTDHRIASLTARLEGGETVGIFPAVGGG